VTGSDTLVFVVDVLGGYRRRPQRTASPQSAGDPKLPSVSPSLAGVAPPVTIPKAAPPGTLQAETLIQGTGPPVAKGKLLVAQYEGLTWRTGKVFDSPWQRGVPASFVIGTGKVIPGWDKTLVGQRVGSRGAAGDPAEGRPRHAGRRAGRDQGHRHAGLRRRHPRHLLNRWRADRYGRGRCSVIVSISQLHSSSAHIDSSGGTNGQADRPPANN